jgi:hypothetical protein
MNRGRIIKTTTFAVFKIPEDRKGGENDSTQNQSSHRQCSECHITLKELLPRLLLFLSIPQFGNVEDLTRSILNLRPEIGVEVHVVWFELVPNIRRMENDVNTQ